MEPELPDLQAAPKLPPAKVYRVTWDGRPCWTQYHDETDPLPATWDDEPPDVTEGFFDGDQMRQCYRMGVEAERERAAKVCDSVEREQENDHGAANTGGAAACAAAIRGTDTE